jgi:hypothetical protein
VKHLIRSTCTLALLTAIASPVVAQNSAQGGATASAAVEEFMRAASDSNLTRMAQLFGTDRGSAARTNQPSDFARRMVVMQAALGGITVRALGETATEDRDRKLVTTEFVRGNCRVTAPVRAVKAREGWLVLGFDYSQVWDGVNKPCEGTARPNGNSGG